MKIFELFSQRASKSKLDFDLQDDIICFMQNDPEFYRDEYYPIYRKFVKVLDTDRTVSPKAFKPLVKKAYVHYKMKFPTEGLAEDLKDNELDEICEKILSFESEHYHKEKEQEEK